MTWSRSCCARRARAPASSTSPATMTSSCGISRAPISAASSWPTGPPRDRRRPPLPRHPWRSVRRRRPQRYAGWPISATMPTTLPSSSTGWSPRLAAAARAALLVVLVLGQGQGQEGGQASSAASRRCVAEEARRSASRRHHLRPYPPCGDRADRRRRLHQHRRLGRELHRGRRAFRRPLEIIRWADLVARRADVSRLPLAEGREPAAEAA